jgi:hypothetical protein
MHILYLHLKSFRLTSIDAKILSAYSPLTHKEVRICREPFHSEVSQNFIAKKFEKPNSEDKFLFFGYL